MNSIDTAQKAGAIQASFGKTLVRAAQYDQRFSYCLYVPISYMPENASAYTLLVAVHGTDRANQSLRDSFAGFAEQHRCIVLAPLFPAGIEDALDVDNYKYIKFAGIRFDQVLLEMIEEVQETYRLPQQRFLLFGFSGGAHFAHRFLYLYPERVLASTIAAPGSVTLITDEHDWWVGLGNIEEVFGQGLDLATLAKVPIMLTVGAEDTDTQHIITDSRSPKWMEGATLAGTNRIDRLETLYSNFKSHSLQVSKAILPGVKHEVLPHTQSAARFFADILSD